MEFEWDRKKAVENERKHSVSFEEAAEVFADDYSSTVSDPDRSIYEQRLVIFGRTEAGRRIVVAFTERTDRIRIISARPMTRGERKGYEQ